MRNFPHRYYICKYISSDIFKKHPPYNIFKMCWNAHFPGFRAFCSPTWLYVCVVFLYTTEGQERVSVYCRRVTVIAEAIKCRYSDSCSGSFIKWWRERESWKDEANRRGCKSAEEGSAEVDETFPGRLPPGSSGPRWPSDISPFSSLRSYFMPFFRCTKLPKEKSLYPVTLYKVSNLNYLHTLTKNQEIFVHGVSQI